MKASDIAEGYICEGDYIRDGGKYREISGFTIYSAAQNDTTVNFTDGGCMGIDQVRSSNIYLESEVHG